MEGGGEVWYRYGRSVGKYVKCGVDEWIDNIVGWGVDRDVGAGFFRCIDDDVNMSKV